MQSPASKALTRIFNFNVPAWTVLTQKLPLFVGAYFVLLLCLFHNKHLCPDTYYYWMWSQHLQLSYYDGPPLIAYLLRLYTTLFGNQELTLFCFSLCATAVTTRILWNCSRLWFDEITAAYAVLLWLLTPGILHFFILQVTYNVPMILFWSLCFYCFIQIILTRKTYYYYLGGSSFGCLLLAKYTGILLVISLLLTCLYYKEYRFVLRNPHLYLGLVLALFMFSPVLIWNYQQDWISFKFQLNHGFNQGSHDPVQQIGFYLLHNVIEYNVSLMALIVLIWQHRVTVFSPKYGVLLFPTALVVLFFLISACFSSTDINWTAPAFFTGILWLANYVAAIQAKLLRWGMLVTLALLSCWLVLGDSYPKVSLNQLGGWGVVAAMQTMLQKIPPEVYQNQLIVTSDYQLAGFVAYFLHRDRDDLYNLKQISGQDSTRLAQDFIYLSDKPLIKHSGKVNHCKITNHYHVTQPRVFYPAMTWHLYLYLCKGNGT